MRSRSHTWWKKLAWEKITVKRDAAKVAGDVPYVVKGRIPCCCAGCSLFSRIAHKYRKADNQDEGVFLQCLLTENCIIWKKRFFYVYMYNYPFKSDVNKALVKKISIQIIMYYICKWHFLGLLRYGYYVRTKRYEKKNPSAKDSERRDIDENKIVQWLGETFGIIRRLAAEWRRIPFYDAIGNMAGSNKRWRQRQFKPSQEWCFKEDDKWQFVVGIDDLRVCTKLQVLSKTDSRLWFYTFKKYKNGNSARRIST